MNTVEAFFPQMAFANFVGPVSRKFAWFPLRLWDGSYRWLCFVARRRAFVHWHLTPGGGDGFWVYSATQDKEGE